MRIIDKLFPTRRPAFTIVELLVVIVVIGILAAITIVSYSGISNRAKVSSLQSDLANASTLLKNYNTLYGSYPTSLDGSNCPTAPTVDANYCLKTSLGNTLVYSQIAGKTFHLTSTNGTASYSVTDMTAPAIATTGSGSSVGSACPSGFIPVPGSGTYGTNDFCLMKYEAKNAGGTVPVSQASGAPWVSINQTNAAAYSSNVVGCDGCHLITEAEWMTVAQNVLAVASNWSGGSVGSGYIYSGHNDNDPTNALAADSNDSNGYYGTGSASGNQSRTLTLTNGEVIWDFAGNVSEWTAGQTTGGQPGITGEGAFAWKQWTAVTEPGSLPANPLPRSIGLSGSDTWNSSQGVGQLYSSVSDASLRGFRRGGRWSDGGQAGVLNLDLGSVPGSTNTAFGFRASR